MGLIEQVFKIVQSLPYEHSDYVAGKFDCVNMSVIAHKELKKNGIDNYICIGVNSKSSGHAWVEIKNANIEVESTTKYIHRIMFNRLEFNMSRRRYDNLEKFREFAKRSGGKELNRKLATL